MNIPEPFLGWKCRHTALACMYEADVGVTFFYCPDIKAHDGFAVAWKKAGLLSWQRRVTTPRWRLQATTASTSAAVV
ncbi:hypothetical protein [Xylella taiwanensis]|nr:hypothetical protein [Xylella taiwanensis]MCD8465257.1 hypothetical protein [Xylella taiwanensis]